MTRSFDHQESVGMAVKDRHEKLALWRVLAEAGLSQTQAAKIMGVSRQRAGQVAEVHGIVFRNGSRNPNITPEVLQEFARAGVSMAETARQIGVSAAAIGHAARRFGITFEPGHKDIDRRERIRALHEQGLTQEEIGKRVGCLRNVVSRLLVEMGIRRAAQKGVVKSAVRDGIAAGMSPREIAEKHGLNLSSVWSAYYAQARR